MGRSELLGVLVLLLVSGCPQAPGPTLTNVVQMNDVSILLPLATSRQDFDAYLTAGDVQVPQALFTAFNVPGRTAIGTGGPELEYSTLKVIALRVDPCFANLGPVTDVAKCENQLRLILQSLTFADGGTSAEDTGLHVFYSLTRTQLIELVNELTAVRLGNADAGDLGPLAVHPIIAKQGLAGSMGAGVSAVVKKYAGASNLMRMTRLYASSDFWDFNGIDLAGGVATPMVIPTIPDGGTVVSFISPAAASTVNGTFLPPSSGPDQLQLLANVAEADAASVQARQSAFDAMVKIENPALDSPNTIDCASCHVAEVARVVNAPMWGLSATGNASAFVAPSSVPQVDLALTAPVVPGTSNKNFHAFSYRATEPRINQRVVNETAVIVDSLNGLVAH